MDIFLLFFLNPWVIWIRKCFRKISPVVLYKAKEEEASYKSPGLGEKGLNRGGSCVEVKGNNQLSWLWWIRDQEGKDSKMTKVSAEY